MTYSKMIYIGICFMTLLIAAGCGSGGGGAASTSGGAVQKKAYLTGASVQNVKGIELTMTLPDGVTVDADASGGTLPGVITMLAPNSAGTSVSGKFTPASGTTAGLVKIVIANSSTPFTVGDLFVVTCNVAAGLAVTPGQFSFTNLLIATGVDASGNTMETSANVTASAVL